MFSSAFLFEPPKPIERSNYICDKKFHLDPILEMYKSETKFGIVLISGEECSCYEVIKSGIKYVTYNLVAKIQTRLQKKQKKGGQSAPRFERIRQEKEIAYISKAVTLVINSYYSENHTKCTISSLIVAGPAEQKLKLTRQSDFQKYFSNLLVDIISIPSITQTSVSEVYSNNLSKLLVKTYDTEIQKDVDYLQELMDFADDKLVFGEKEVLEQLQLCNLEYLLISENYDKIDVLQDLNTYGCTIHIIDISQFGIDLVGAKWY